MPSTLALLVTAAAILFLAGVSDQTGSSRLQRTPEQDPVLFHEHLIGNRKRIITKGLRVFSLNGRH